MITMKDVIREGHPTLTKKAVEVSVPVSHMDKKLLRSLHEYVVNSQVDSLAKTHDLRPAVGIAAPQVNVSKRMFAVHVEDFDGILYSYALINPKIIKHSDETIYLPGGEGCLSVDRTTEGLTPRYQEITISALNYDLPSGQIVPIELELSGYIAIVFQHEYDHLDGIMFTSKLFLELPESTPAFELDND